jgi:hypothetical protein
MKLLSATAQYTLHTRQDGCRILLHAPFRIGKAALKKALCHLVPTKSHLNHSGTQKRVCCTYYLGQWFSCSRSRNKQAVGIVQWLYPSCSEQQVEVSAPCFSVLTVPLLLLTQQQPGPIASPCVQLLDLKATAICDQ